MLLFVSHPNNTKGIGKITGKEKSAEKSSFFAADTGSYDLLIFLSLPSTASRKNVRKCVQGLKGMAANFHKTLTTLVVKPPLDSSFFHPGSAVIKVISFKPVFQFLSV